MEADTKAVVEAIKEQGERYERQQDKVLEGIHDLGEGISEMGKQIAKGFAAGQPKNGSQWQQVVTMLAITAALMGPLYTIVVGLSGNLNEHLGYEQEQAPLVAAAIASLRSDLGEVETQFKNVDNLQGWIRSDQQEVQAELRRMIALDERQSTQILHLSEMGGCEGGH